MTHRSAALALYKQLLRLAKLLAKNARDDMCIPVSHFPPPHLPTEQTAKQLPNPEKQDTVARRIRAEFRDARTAPTTSASEGIAQDGSAEWYLSYGETMLDNLQLQAEHLRRLAEREGQLIIPVDIYNPPAGHFGRWANRGKKWGKRAAPPVDSRK
ncbi:hypothetical protein HKX48_004344 [Thoreauomyces humboldtii]|nr:hypothetical protein HKX48_004344 [Thoreauomyces humboldtii]